MNITADLITSILTQAGDAITCKNLRTVRECECDIIIRFEDDTDYTISIYYTPEIDLIAIGVINSLGSYRLYTRIRYPSILEHDILSEYLIHTVINLEMEHELENMVDTEEG